MAWRWLSEAVLIAAQEEQIAEHGGRAGVRDYGLLTSAMLRAPNKNAYDAVDVFELAAAYAYGLLRNHPFIDGNKRIALVAVFTFLHLNGWELCAPESEATDAILSLANRELEESNFAFWLRNACVPRGSLDSSRD